MQPRMTCRLLICSTSIDQASLSSSERTLVGSRQVVFGYILLPSAHARPSDDNAQYVQFLSINLCFLNIESVQRMHINLWDWKKRKCRHILSVYRLASPHYYCFFLSFYIKSNLFHTLAFLSDYDFSFLFISNTFHP